MLKKRSYKKVVRVTFYLHPTLISEDIICVFLVGDFNNWDEAANPMKLSKKRVEIPFNNGDKAKTYYLSLSLEPNKKYEFRYLIVYEGCQQWHNDWDADHYYPNPFGGDNSVVDTGEN